MADETAEERARRRANTIQYTVVILLCINIMLTFFLALAQSGARTHSGDGFSAACAPDCAVSCRYAPQPSARENFGAGSAQKSRFTPDRLGACAQSAASPSALEATAELRALSAAGAYPGVNIGPPRNASLAGLTPLLAPARAELRALEKIGIL